MPSDDDSRSEPSLDHFLGEPTRELSDWYWLWSEDRAFPVASHRPGLKGRLLTWWKRLLRPFVRAPLGDLWDRQRVFNLILLETLERRQAELDQALDAHAEQLRWLDERTTTGFADLMRHNDALFARVDQKLDRYRRQSRELWSRLGALVAAAEREDGPKDPKDVPVGEAPSVAALAAAQEQQSYLELERRFRGSEEEIAARISRYLPYFQKSGEGRNGEVLDLGCGRGEALALLARHGLSARGIDSSGEMVARCREKGLEAVEGDLFEHLAAVAEGTLAGVVSFHVIEHLPPQSLERLVRLAWRALRPGGVLVLETPSPLSLAMSARDFWIDPTHLRPVHPASLELAFREAGFEPVHRLDLHPFPDDQRLPEIDLATLPADQRPLADEINRLRDVLDDLLFGERDFAVVGIKG